MTTDEPTERYTSQPCPHCGYSILIRLDVRATGQCEQCAFLDEV